MTPITFATYHTDLSEQAVHDILEKFPVFKEQNWQNSLPYAKDCIHLFFQSVRLFHPESKNVILTDQSTPFKEEEGVQICRYDVEKDKPAYMRVLAQIQFLKENKGSHVAFLDYDMLLQDTLCPLFEKDFTLGLSFRELYQGEKHPWPLNGGLMLIHEKHIKEAITFLEKVVKRQESAYPNFLEWGGFQTSINDVVGKQNIYQRKSDIIEVNGAKILLLDTDTYNYTMESVPYTIDYLPEKKILHFKGTRKDAMIYYWNEYLNPRK